MLVQNVKVLEIDGHKNHHHLIGTKEHLIERVSSWQEEFTPTP